MITYKGYFSDGSSINETVWVKQQSVVFDGEAFRAEIIDSSSEGDQEFLVVILFMRETTELEFEVNRNAANSQPQ